MDYDYRKTAVRLKALRESKKLSHDKLLAALREKYGDKFSRQSLLNYENSEEFSAKSQAVKGMSSERLAILADFYRVSVDYLLGLSDNPSVEENKKITQKTLGISPEAVENLAKVTRIKPYPNTPSFRMDLRKQTVRCALDVLLSSDELEGFVRSLYHLQEASEAMRELERSSVEELSNEFEPYCDEVFKDYRLARLDVTESIQALIDHDKDHFLNARDAELIVFNFYARLEEAERLRDLEDAAAAEKFDKEVHEYQDYLEKEGLDEGYGCDETEDN